MNTIGKCLLFAFLVSSSLGHLSHAEDLNCVLLPQLFQNYLKAHYSHSVLDEELKQHTVDQYIKNIDSSRSILWKADVAKLKGSLGSVFAGMGMGFFAIRDI